MRRNHFDAGLPEQARRAVDQARRSTEGAWSPAALALAEETYLRGMVEMRRQLDRSWFVRDLRPVADSLALVQPRAAEAVRAAGARMESARSEAAAVLARLSGVLSTLAEIETRASVPRDGQAGLTEARLGYAEASALMAAGAYGEAVDRAARALERAGEVTDALGEAFLRFADEERVRTWRSWIAEAVAWSRDQHAVALVVVKERNVLDVYRDGRRIQTFAADMGSNNLAQKYRQGDRATPEGRYRVEQMKGRGQSIYYKALLLNYPTPEDLRRIRSAKEAGAVPDAAGPGALIEIHGEGGRGEDWTNGCVAVSNFQMDELFRLVKVGTPVVIVGGDGSNGSFSSLASQFQREF